MAGDALRIRVLRERAEAEAERLVIRMRELLVAEKDHQVIEQGLRMPGSGYFNVAANAARTLIRYTGLRGAAAATLADATQLQGGNPSFNNLQAVASLLRLQARAQLVEDVGQIALKVGPITSSVLCAGCSPLGSPGMSSGLNSVSRMERKITLVFLPS